MDRCKLANVGHAPHPIIPLADPLTTTWRNRDCIVRA
jgi:hypothetical protein